VNIRELAKLANVSPTTVSKVLNHKAKDISEETKKRVWDIAKQYNYTPYQKILDSLDLSGNLIGLMVPQIDAMHVQIIKGAENAAYENGFEIAVCSVGDSPDLLKSRINSLRRKKAEGFILSRVKHHEINDNFALRVLDNYTDYTVALHLAYKKLINHGHKKIGLLVSNLKHTDTQKKLDACKNAFLKENRSFDISLVYECNGTTESSAIGMKYLLSNKITAVIAFDDIICSGVYRLLQNEALRIPQDISVLCFDDYSVYPYLYPEPAVIKSDYEKIGYQAVKDLLCEIEGSASNESIVAADISWGNGIAPFYEQKGLFKRKVLVVGYLNMDTIIHIPEETDGYGKSDINASDVEIMAGGKASLQSASAAKLGGNCYVIGRVGNDLNGEKIQNELSKMNINTGGIMFDNENPTGKAVIYVPKEGKTSYDIDYGANMHLTARDIERHEDLFSGAAYCLLSMQLSQDVFYHTARVCKRKDVKLICSIGPAFELDNHSFLGAHILVSTITGIDILIPGKYSFEEKINKLLHTHCENIVITMEYEGQCVLLNSEQQSKFTVKDFEFANHTAGVDCFCGALTVALTGGKNLNEAVSYALTGAALTMSRDGSLPSLPTSDEIMDNLSRVYETAYLY